MDCKNIKYTFKIWLIGFERLNLGIVQYQKLKVNYPFYFPIAFLSFYTFTIINSFTVHHSLYNALSRYL